MKLDKRIIMSIIWILIGGTFVALAFAGKVDSYWNGLGSALLVVGILQILRFVRFNKNKDYREKMEIAESDERNHFIRGKAWAWTGYIFILVAAVSGIVLRALGYNELSSAASCAVGLMLAIYWVVYLVLQKKY